MLVFCAAKRGCEGLKTAVRRQGFAAETLHGDKTQQARGRFPARAQLGQRRPVATREKRAKDAAQAAKQGEPDKKKPRRR